jgi:FAD/FMN-containing dehydrogenase
MIVDALKNIVGEKYCLTEDISSYVTAWRGGFVGKAQCVVLPANTKEVRAIVTLCHETNTPITPQGGNTGLVGGGVPDASGEGILLNLSRMNNVREVDKANYTFTLEAGCILHTAQEIAAEADRYFPLSIGSEGSAQIGGVVSTNAGGTTVLRYGNARDLVLGLEVVLPNGQVWDTQNTLRKDNTGYDIKQCFIGAEGTLGVITAASFKLFPTIKQKETLFLGISSVEDAITLYQFFCEESGSILNAFEVISHTALELVLKHVPETRTPLSTEAPYYLLIECTSSQSGTHLRGEVEDLLAKAFEAVNIVDGVMAENIKQARAFWHLRETISEAEKEEGRGVHFDISVPISKMPAFIMQADALLATQCPEATVLPFGHIGDGNVHYNLCLPKGMTDAAFSAAKATVKNIVYDTLSGLNGSISAEHGIGVERKGDLAKVKSQTELDVMRAIKKAIDPLNIMNPGKIF